MSQDISDISFDRSTLDPNYQTESSSASSTMSGGGEPVSSRSCRGAYYTGADDKVILQFILDNGRCRDTGGIALWQLMEEKQVLEGRSWQSLKERFKRSILNRLDCFDLSEDQKQQLDPNFSEELNFDDWNAEDVGGDVYSGDGREEARGGHSNNARGRGVRRGRSSRGASLEASNQKQQLDPNFSEELDFDDWNVDDLGGDVYSGDGQEEARGGHSNIARGRGVRRGRGGRGASLEASNPGQVRGRGRGRGRPRGRGRGTDKLPRHPNFPRRALDQTAMEQMDPEEYLELNKNGNSRRNQDVALRSYERVMNQLGQSMGEEFEPLETASIVKLPFLLMKYFQAAKREDDTVYSSGTLSSHFNSFANVLSSRKEEPVDVKTDVRFDKVREMVRVRSTQAKAMGRGPGCNAKKPLKAEHMIAARDAGTIGSSNPKALLTQVWVAAVAGFGNRTGQECKDMNNGDLVFGPFDEEKNRHNWIKLHERLTKTRRGSNPGDAKELTPKIFPMDDHPETCYVRAIAEYQRRKTPEQRGDGVPFFLNPNPRAVKKPLGHKWYSTVPMGINRISELIKEAMEEAGVDVQNEDISAISVRKAMIQSGVDANMPPVTIARMVGHKSLVSQERYINSEGLHQIAGSRAIHRRLHHVELNKKYGDELQEVEAEHQRNHPGRRDNSVGSTGSASCSRERERSRSPVAQSDPGSRSRDESSFRSSDGTERQGSHVDSHHYNYRQPSNEGRRWTFGPTCPQEAYHHPRPQTPSMPGPWQPRQPVGPTPQEVYHPRPQTPGMLSSWQPGQPVMSNFQDGYYEQPRFSGHPGMANCYGSLPGSCGQRFGFHDMGTAGNSTGLGEQRRWSFSGFENRGGWGNRMMSSEGAPLGYQGPSNPHFTGCWQEPQNSWQVGVSPGQQGRSSQGWQNQQADWYQNPHNHGTPENLQMLGGRQPSKMDAWAGSEKDNGSFSRCVEGQGNKYGKSEVPRWDMAERDEMKRCDQRSCDKLPDGSEMCSQEDRLSDEQLAKVMECMAEVPEADLEFTSKLLARYDWDVYLAVGTLKMQLQACSSQDAANVAKKAAQESASSSKEVDGYKGLSSERSVVLAERNVEQRCEENSSGGAGTAKKPSLPPGSTSRKSIKENEEPIVVKDLKVGDVFLHKYGKTQPPWPCRITGFRRLTKKEKEGPALFYFGTHDTGFALPDASDLKRFSLHKMPAKKRPLLKRAYDEASEWTST